MNLRELTMKYGRLVAFIRHNSAEILALVMDSHSLLVL
jgi:hypothetical protein